MRSVSMRPGAMQLTVIPFGPSSRASDFAQPTTPGRTEFESARLSIGSRTVRRRDVDDAPGRAPLEVAEGRGRSGARPRRAGAGRPLRPASASSSGGGRSRRAARVVHEDVDAAVGVDGCLRRAARGRPALVTSPATARPPIRSASRSRSSRRRANMTTFAPSPASDSAMPRPMPGGRAADDRRAAARARDPRYFLFRTPTTSRTAAADARSIFFSSAVRRSFTISSTPAAPSFTGNAHVEAVDPVLALEIRGAREDALLVEADRVDHLRGRGPGRVPGRRAEQRDELAAAELRPLDELADARLRHAAPAAARRRRSSPRRPEPSGRRGRRARPR